MMLLVKAQYCDNQGRIHYSDEMKHRIKSAIEDMQIAMRRSTIFAKNAIKLLKSLIIDCNPMSGYLRKIQFISCVANKYHMFDFFSYSIRMMNEHCMRFFDSVEAKQWNANFADQLIERM